MHQISQFKRNGEQANSGDKYPDQLLALYLGLVTCYM